MTPSKLIRIGIAVVLGLHAVAHANALTGLVRQALGGGSTFEARLWALPNIDPMAAAAIGLPFWIVATGALALAALSFLGIHIPRLSWRQLAIAGALASLVGVVLFLGTWPGAPDGFYTLLDTGVAVAVNLVILGALMWRHWPPQPMFGR